MSVRFEMTRLQRITERDDDYELSEDELVRLIVIRALLKFAEERPHQRAEMLRQADIVDLGVGRTMEVSIAAIAFQMGKTMATREMLADCEGEA